MTTPTAVFRLPQASTVGLEQERARTLGHDIVVYRTRFRPMPTRWPGPSGGR